MEPQAICKQTQNTIKPYFRTSISQAVVTTTPLIGYQYRQCTFICGCIIRSEAKLIFSALAWKVSGQRYTLQRRGGLVSIGNTPISPSSTSVRYANLKMNQWQSFMENDAVQFLWCPTIPWRSSGRNNGQLLSEIRFSEEHDSCVCLVKSLNINWNR